MRRPADYANALAVVLISLLLAILGNPIQTTQERRHIPWWFWVIVPCALLGWIFWWWLKKEQGEQALYYRIGASASKSQPVPSPIAPQREKREAHEKEQSEESRVDDLTVIEGIGPKIARMLYDQGITTFEKLSETDPEQLRSFFRQAKLYFVDPSTWPEQAKLASQGRWDELERLKAELIAGRRRSD